ncbi:MAG TPA: DUF177 domain-containing protein [Dongiaceae bacterium]|jgi:uncharacterized metal-binding protein YceD (DUF177 family)|nr:DUF177 domain-containing protein [Dongiaceae bacterium]
MQPADPVEFSRPMALDRVSATPHREEIVATDKERAALAERFGLLSLDNLTASFTLKRARKDLVRVKGRVSAELVQACVVTLDPVPARIDERFEVDFLEGVQPAVDDIELDVEGAEAPEPALDGWIDLGELAAEQLGLAIDPYPRKPDAEVPAEWKSEASTEPALVVRPNPFAALEKLKASKG